MCKYLDTRLHRPSPHRGNERARATPDIIKIHDNDSVNSTSPAIKLALEPGGLRAVEEWTGHEQGEGQRNGDARKMVDRNFKGKDAWIVRSRGFWGNRSALNFSKDRENVRRFRFCYITIKIVPVFNPDGEWKCSGKWSISLSIYLHFVQFLFR